MEEDDDEIPPQRPPTPTVAAAPSPPPLPNQPRRNTSNREGNWSEAATAALIDAWIERYLALNRRNLKQLDWKHVADIVAAHEGRRTTTYVQCRYRMDTVKKKYKAEKSLVAAGVRPSNWPFFNQLDQLFNPVGVRSSLRKRSERPPVADSNEPEPESSSDGLPPFRKRRRRVINSGNSLNELPQAILKFGKAYEHAETAKIQQRVEMEKERMKFRMDLEWKTMQYYIELSQPKKKKTKKNNADSNGKDPINKNNSDSKN